MVRSKGEGREEYDDIVGMKSVPLIQAKWESEIDIARIDDVGHNSTRRVRILLERLNSWICRLRIG